MFFLFLVVFSRVSIAHGCKLHYSLLDLVAPVTEVNLTVG